MIIKTLYSTLILLFTFLFAAGGASAQDAKAGIELYDKGDFRGAINLLKNSDDVEGILHLGLAYEKAGESGKAKDAFKKAFANAYERFFKKFDEWQKTEPAAEKKTFAAFLREVKDNNRFGYLAANKAYALGSDIFQFNEWRIKAKILMDAVAVAQETPVGEIYFITDKSLEGAKMTKVPMIAPPKDDRGIPLFSRRGHSRNKPVVITVFMVVGKDGKVKLKLPTDEVFDAFTLTVLEGLDAAQFQPAAKDGKPVAYYHRFNYSYHFN